MLLHSIQLRFSHSYSHASAASTASATFAASFASAASATSHSSSSPQQQLPTVLSFYCFIHSHASVHLFPLTLPLRLPPRSMRLPLRCVGSLTFWGYIDSLDWSKRSTENTSSWFTVTVLLLAMIAAYTKFFQLNGDVLYRSQS